MKPDFYEKEDEKEFAELRELLGRLEKVSAPPDFDFRLKARWQAAKAKNAKHSFFGVPQFAYGFGALVLCAVAVWLVPNFFTNKPVPEIIEVTETKPAISTTENVGKSVTEKAEITPLDNPAANSAPLQNKTTVEPLKKIDDGENLAKNVSKRRENLAAKLKNKPNKSVKISPEPTAGNKSDDEILSKTSAITKTPKSLTPPGIPDTINGEKGIKADDSLRIFGIETAEEGENLRVESIKPRSLAEDAGLKKGDIIEKFNGKKPREISANEFKEITLTVKRENKLQEIKIAPKP